MIKIELIRADTRGFKFQRKNADGSVIMTTPNSIYFTVKSSFDTPNILLQKEMDDMTMDENGFWHFKLLPEDTAKIPYGVYVCDIQITQDDNVKTTTGTFKLTGEATWTSTEVDDE